MKNIFLFFLLLFLAACASKPPAIFPEPVRKPIPEQDSSNVPERAPIVDLDGLQSFLKMDRAAERLGHIEKSFPTCEVGYGYPSNRNCRKNYFTLIHFQLQCRFSNEDNYTEALGAADMVPLKGRTVRWSLENKKGLINLDDHGYGQIRMVSEGTVRFKRLKLNIENDNLYMKAGEITKIVTPSNWCH